MTQTKKMLCKNTLYPAFSVRKRHFGYKPLRNRVKIPPALAVFRGNFCPKKYVGKELDMETGLYYYGARYLDPKISRWLSGDPAVGEYIPSAPASDEARKQNRNLPGMGGVFNYANLHVYHYGGNNPVKYVDPDGEIPVSSNWRLGIRAHTEIIQYLTEEFIGSRPKLFLPAPKASRGNKGAFFVDLTRQVGSVLELYEIKPISYMSSNRGDLQLEKYVNRARERGLNAEKGTSILSEINGLKIETWMFEGEIAYPDQLGFITLRTDEVNHPGMIFYELDDGKPPRERNPILDFLENLVPVGIPVPSPLPAPLPAPLPVPLL